MEAATVVPETGSQLLEQLLVMVAAPVLAREQLGAADFDAAWAAGQALDAQAAFELAAAALAGSAAEPEVATVRA